MSFLKRLFKAQPPLTQSQQAEAEREQRVADREPIDYSYTVFWTKTARNWEAVRRSAVAQSLEVLLKSPEFQANPFERKYTLDDLDG
ncbi:MAG TPA: hypothetical protein VFF59_05350, partial [Anaerolineae bacterium]|nr:hypothetical protein [Anaerolineae bacterium]